MALLSLYYPPEQTGNAPYAGSFTKGLHERGISVCALTAHPHYPGQAFRDGYGQWTLREMLDGISITRLRHYLPRRPLAFKRLLSEVSFGMRLIFARWGQPDVVVFVSPALFSTALALLRARLAVRKVATVVWVQDLYSLGVTETATGGAVTARIMKWVESETLKSASKIVVIHSRFATYVTDVLGVDPSRIEIVRNWSHLKPTSFPTTDIGGVRAKYGWSADETIVLHAGNMGAKQGLENVVDAARIAGQQELPLKFVLLGDGNQRESLEEYAKGVGHLQFLNPIADGSFQRTLAAANVLLVNERAGVSEMSVPSKLTSYFTSGRPVVAATDPSGVTSAEIAVSGGGVTVPSGEPQLLVDACIALREDPERSAMLGANGRRYQRETLAQEAAIDRFARVIEDLTIRPHN